MQGPDANRARAVLSKYMDVTYDTRNMTWALNWDHSAEYVKAVADAVEAADARGGEEAVLEVLERIAEILNSGQKFRG